MGPWPSLEIWLKVSQELAPSDSTQLPSMASPGCHQRALGPPQNEVTVTFLLKKGAGLRGCTTDHQHGTSPERQEPDQCILSLSGPSVDSTQGLNPHKNHLQSVGGVSYTHLYLMWGGIFFLWWAHCSHRSELSFAWLTFLCHKMAAPPHSCLGLCFSGQGFTSGGLIPVIFIIF